MTLTATGLPRSQLHQRAGESRRLREIAGVKSASVQVVWEPPWDISRLSEAARKQLGIK
jgi:metal-sulfur cluster biosynthetic enzyme